MSRGGGRSIVMSSDVQSTSWRNFQVGSTRGVFLGCCCLETVAMCRMLHLVSINLQSRACWRFTIVTFFRSLWNSSLQDNFWLCCSMFHVSFSRIFQPSIIHPVTRHGCPTSSLQGCDVGMAASSIAQWRLGQVGVPLFTANQLFVFAF